MEYVDAPFLSSRSSSACVLFRPCWAHAHPLVLAGSTRKCGKHLVYRAPSSGGVEVPPINAWLEVLKIQDPTRSTTIALLPHSLYFPPLWPLYVAGCRITQSEIHRIKTALLSPPVASAAIKPSRPCPVASLKRRHIVTPLKGSDSLPRA